MIKSFRVIQVIKIVIPVSVILYVLYRSQHELRSMSIEKSINVLHSLTPTQVLFFIAFGMFSMGIMSFYDYFLAKSLKIKISVGRVWKVGFIANSLNGILGFGGLIGAGLRTMFYREYVDDTKSLVKGIAWMTTALVNGLSLFSLLTLLHVFPVGNLLYEKIWIIPFLVVVSCIFPGYMLLTYFPLKRRKKEIGASTVKTPLGQMKMASVFSFVSIVEWFCIAILLYGLLRVFDINLPFTTAMGIFTLSAIAGFASFVPGGFGSFDLAYLLGMDYYGVSQEHVLSVLVVYRVVYYFIPFLFALILTVFEYGGVTLKKIEDKPIIGPAIETTGVIWAIYRELIAKAGQWALAVLILYIGCLNIYSVWAPAIRFSLLNDRLPMWLIQFSYDVVFLCGVVLLLSVRGVYHRTKRAYVIVLPALLVGGIFHLIKSFDYEEAIASVLMFSILLLIRGQFKRNSLILTSIHYIRSTLFVFAILFLYYLMGIGLLTLDQTHFIRTELQVIQTIFFTIFFLPIVLFIGLHLFEKLYREEIGEVIQKEKFKAFLQRFNGNHLSHLAFLGDKRIFYSKSEKACIQFRVKGRHLIVLGDPIGEESEKKAVLREFMCEADRFGYLVVFYQVDQEYMHLYHDYGYNFFKLGEEAIVSLEEFSLSGKKRSSMRATFNRFEREGYAFHVIQPPFSSECMKELEMVSNSWLGRKQEKGFSMGYYNQDYLNQSSIAMLKDAENKVIGFVSLMPGYNDSSFSIDLMRYLPDAPSGCMDVIFIHLLKWGKEQGYETFNMGMAPLSNVGIDERSFLSERISATVFNNIRYMYSFSGLRQFKAKYHPQWSGKYLAFRKNRTLGISLITVTRLISSGPIINKKSFKNKVIAFIKGRAFSQ